MVWLQWLTLAKQPADLARQSFPFSYLSIDVASRDGAAHEVQVYVHMTGGELLKHYMTSMRSH